MSIVEERYEIWQRLLIRPQGVSYKELEKEISTKIEEGADYEVLKQDKLRIQRLLKENGMKLEESTKGRAKRFYVRSAFVNLVEFSQSERVARPYMAIIDMLSKCNGFLPEEFLRSLCEKYQMMSEKVNVEKSISFETDYDCMSELDMFPDIYDALNEHAIWISFHPANKPELSTEGVFYPEHLKQYRSNWFVFGMFAEENKPAEFKKIPLNNIDDYKDVDINKYPFIDSHIKNYDDYFKEIIGVDNTDSNPVETIKFRIRNRMYNRLKANRLHYTQKDCKELDTPKFKGMQIRVKYNIDLLREILTLGSDIEIVEPPRMRSKVKKELEKALQMYKK